MDQKTTRLLLGLTVGFIGGGLISGFLTWQLVTKQTEDLRAGWSLVPVVVASQDIREGEVMTFDKVTQRSVPGQFVSSSFVKPDGAHFIMNQRLLVPVQAGDPLLWSQFETRSVTSAPSETKQEELSTDTTP
jgi:pilus assembly protein CpaB